MQTVTITLVSAAILATSLALGCGGAAECGPEEFRGSPDARACTAHSTCAPGEQFMSAGTPTTDTVCEPCPIGTYCAGGVAEPVQCDWRDTDHDSATPCSTLVQVTAGDKHTCALDDAGDVTCWGYNFEGPTAVPDSLGTIVQVTAGEEHTCALNAAGRVTCWGLGESGQTAVPGTLGTIVQIDAGGSESCAVDDTGDVTCWGLGHFSGNTFVPSTLGTITKISAGWDHTCVLDDVGDVTCWSTGFAVFGQTAVPDTLGTVVQVSAGRFHTCTVDDIGLATCWGQDPFGGGWQYRTRSGVRWPSPPAPITPAHSTSPGSLPAGAPTMSAKPPCLTTSNVSFS